MKLPPYYLKFSYFCFILLIASCNSKSQSRITFQKAVHQDFLDYWYKGKAELSSYNLEQARYGELRKGNAVLIFVTEDFSKKKQVKLDKPKAHHDDAVSVLKLNLTKKFITGIYPYSILLSSFKPVDMKEYPHSLKLTTSVQEWCGQVFTQLNLGEGDDEYDIKTFSYFESEGDKLYQVPVTLLEDEIWQVIRMDPSQLPLGNISLIPSAMISRLLHQPFKPTKARASIKRYVGNEFLGDSLVVYSLEFRNTGREKKIYFEKAFPHHIAGWKETYKDGFGDQAKVLVTKGILKKRIKLDYWNYNKNKDLHYNYELENRSED
ncbi:hypothetical protein [Xanthovirga aplysinae]|uniref:hypothetical protein n=1 Tax=Xanthovirga aplysinae TaxID=2529853 RepID=UPI0012BC63F8|nr:hypothetical protein [Xanthovirga aplysinae]MTI32588.1 hypothetical protein [Xanthovirga aplysinae]